MIHYMYTFPLFKTLCPTTYYARCWQKRNQHEVLKVISTLKVLNDISKHRIGRTKKGCISSRGWVGMKSHDTYNVYFTKTNMPEIARYVALRKIPAKINY